MIARTNLPRKFLNNSNFQFRKCISFILQREYLLNLVSKPMQNLKFIPLYSEIIIFVEISKTLKIPPPRFWTGRCSLGRAEEHPFELRLCWRRIADHLNFLPTKRCTTTKWMRTIHLKIEELKNLPKFLGKLQKFTIYISEKVFLWFSWYFKFWIK